MEAEAQAAPATVTFSDRTATALAALQVRDFRLLWLNSFSFFIGRGMQMVTVSWLVLHLTDSPSLVGLALFVQGAPMALFSLAAGIGADRLDRRTLLIVSQLASASMTAILATLTLTGTESTWMVFVLAFGMGTAMALGQPSRQAVIPSLVEPERLLNAVVLNSIVLNLSFVVGPALAGGLLASLDFGGTFLVQTGVLVAGLLPLLVMRAPPPERRQGTTSIMSDLREGLAYIAGSDLLRSLFVVTAFTGIFFVGTYQAVLPVFARDVLDVGPTGFGFLSGALGLGMLGGSIFIATRGDMERKGEVLLWSLLIGSAVFFAFAVSRWYAVSLLTMLAWGFGGAFFMNLTMAMIQSHTRDRLMGRVMSVQALAFFGVSPLGNLEAGVLAEAIGAPATTTIGAAAVGLMALALLVRQPELRAAR